MRWGEKKKFPLHTQTLLTEQPNKQKKSEEPSHNPNVKIEYQSPIEETTTLVEWAKSQRKSNKCPVDATEKQKHDKQPQTDSKEVIPCEKSTAAKNKSVVH